MARITPPASANSASGQVLSYIDTVNLFTFDGTGGQVAATFADIPAMGCPAFTVGARPIRARLEANWKLKNGATKFTGIPVLSLRVLCTAAPTPADVGVELFRAVVQRDYPTASTAAVNAVFDADNLIRSRVFTVGAGGFLAGQIAAGAGYEFKLQMTMNTVTNISGLLQLPNSATNATPVCLLEFTEG